MVVSLVEKAVVVISVVLSVCLRRVGPGGAFAPKVGFPTDF